MPREIQSFPLRGGLNVAQSQITLKPGELVDGQNIEVSITGGYRRVDGYERFDGRATTPSANTYSVIGFGGAGPRELQYGDNLVGQSSGATATACGPASIASGNYVTSTASGVLGITLIAGTFAIGETVFVNGVYSCVVNLAVDAASIDDANYDDWTRGAANAARALIGKVPGSGPIRGVIPYNGTTYAFKDNAGATAGVMWKATTNGWTAVSFNQVIAFDTGVLLIPEFTSGSYATIVGNSSGATATVVRVALQSGVWGTNAKGLLAVINVVGTFTVLEAIKVAGTTRATLTALPVAVTLPAGGRYEFDEWNFYGSFDTKRLYGVNGVGKGFEFDNHNGQDVFVPISSGMPTDVPEHIAIHKNYLYFTFKGSIQNGGSGDPHNWTARLGASELGIGDQITAIRSIRQDVLGIASINSIHLLYGDGASGVNAWSLKQLSREVGCFVGCMTEIPGSTSLYDTNGVLNLSAVQQFGDFKTESSTEKIDSALRRVTASPIAMFTNRNLSQLRLLFADGRAYYATLVGSKIAGWTPIVFAHSFNCVGVGEDSTGQEVQYAGGNDGYVYKLNTGNSFDGTAIESLMRLPFFHYGSPERKKRFRKIVLEMDSPSKLNLQWATDFSYGDQQYATYSPVFFANNGGEYDVGIYGQFVYDGGFLTAPLANIAGVGKNMSVLIRQSSDIARPWSIQSCHIHFSPWGIQR